MLLLAENGLRQLNRYSDSLRAERSGDRIPLGTRFSSPVQTDPGAHPASYTVGTGSFPAVKRPGCAADHSPPFSAVVKKEQSYTSIPHMVRTTCTQPQCPYEGALYLFTFTGNSFGVYLRQFHIIAIIFCEEQLNFLSVSSSWQHNDLRCISYCNERI